MKYLVKVAYRQLKDLLYRIRTFSARARALRTFPDLSALNNPYFIVGIPGSLHVVELCLKFVPSDVDIVLVANGLDAWELGWAREHLKVKTTVVIERMLDHGDVLDLLFDQYPRPFGILDYDCFVLDPAYFYKMQALDPKTLANGLFVHKNEQLNLEFPETFMLFFNSEVIRQIRRTYRVKSVHYNYLCLAPAVKRRLKTVGVDQAHHPEAYKDYFDTLRLIYSLGYADGYRCNFPEKLAPISKPGYKVYHVGGISFPGLPKTKWGTRGVYLWRRLLEVHPDAELRERYWRRYGSFSADDLLKLNAGLVEKIGSEYFDFVETALLGSNAAC